MKALVVTLLLRALPGLPATHVENVAAYLANALSRDHTVDPVLAVAILSLESGGLSRACANDRYGGSSRGLFQIRVPRSRCGDRKRLDLYDVRKNTSEGVKILAMLKRYHRGDIEKMLRQYSGGAAGYSKRVHATMERIK